MPEKRRAVRGVFFYTYDDNYNGKEIEMHELNPQTFKKLISSKDYVGKSVAIKSAFNLISFFDGRCEATISCKPEIHECTERPCECTTTTTTSTTPRTTSTTPSTTSTTTTPSTTSTTTTPSTTSTTTTSTKRTTKTYIPPPGVSRQTYTRWAGSYRRYTGHYSFGYSWKPFTGGNSWRTRRYSSETTTTTERYRQKELKTEFNPIENN
ncbi:hypothetical protein ACKWTF_016197 [Chironomus riparius]